MPRYALLALVGSHAPRKERGRGPFSGVSIPQSVSAGAVRIGTNDAEGREQHNCGKRLIA